MLLTKPQLNRFWREWLSIVLANGWQKQQAETERHALLRRAGFTSLTQVDHVNGFTAVLKELAALQENLTGMVRADANPRRMMIWNIEKKAPNGYWRPIAADRHFGTDLDAMTDVQLQQLLYTVSDRAVHAHRTATETQRRQVNGQRRAAAPEPRINFTDLPASATSAPAAVAYAKENAPF